jgi:glycosyltransferase involved in cell wall biosynthesis
MTIDAVRQASPPMMPSVARNPAVARSTMGLPDLPSIVAMGPFEDRMDAEDLAEAFAEVRGRSAAQIILFGTGRQRSIVVRCAFARGVGSDVHLLGSDSAGWSDVVAAADVVIPGTASGATSLLDVLSVGRPVVAPIEPTTTRLVLPTSTGLLYRRGDVNAMAAALLRILTNSTLRHGMTCRASAVTCRRPLVTRVRSTHGNDDA